MEVQVEYFAILRDQAGCEKEVVSGETPTPAEIYEGLKKKYGFTLERGHLRVAVNDEFAAWDQPLETGDRVVFIPTVAGG